MNVAENPFFIREVRAYSRRSWGPLSWFVLAAAALPLFSLWLGSYYDWTNARGDAVWLRGLLLGTTAGSHGLLCALVGWQLGQRVFGTEHRRHTLEVLRLVSTSPWIWVLQKLAFPLYWLMLVWLAALPGCMALVIRGTFLPLAILPGLTLAGCAGLLTFASALTIAPDRIGLPRSSERSLPLADRLSLSAIRLVATWIGWLLLRLAFEWVWRGSRNETPNPLPRSLLGGLWLREDHALALMLATYAGSALAAAWAWANPSSPLADRLHRGLRGFTIALAYLLLVGLTWQGGHWVWRAVLILVPVSQGFQLWKEQRKLAREEKRRAVKDDRRGVVEVAAVQCWWDNPVLVRDLRVGLRGTSLLWLFLRQWIVIAVVGMMMVALLLGGPWARMPPDEVFRIFSVMMATMTGWVSFVSVMRIGTRASLQWQGERRMNTIPQLLLSPVTGHEVIRGRWVASLIEGLTAAAPWLLGFGFFTLTSFEGGNLGQLLLIALWIFSLGVLLSVSTAAGIRPVKSFRDGFTAYAVAFGLFIAEPLLLIWGIAVLDEFQDPTTTICTGLLLANVVAVPALLHWAAANVETHRGHSLD